MSGNPSIRALIGIAFLAAASAGHAHLSGTLEGVDMYTVLTPRADGLMVELDQHFGQLTTATFCAGIDTDRDGQVAEDELKDFIVKRTPLHMQFLRGGITTAAGVEDKLSFCVPGDDALSNVNARFVDDGSGVKTLRMQWRYLAPWPTDVDPVRDGPLTVDFTLLCPFARFSSQMVLGEPCPEIVVQDADIPLAATVPRPPDVVPPAAPGDAVPKIVRARLVCRWPTAAMSALEPCTSGDEGGVKGTASADRTPAGKERWIQARVLELLRPPFSARARMLALALCFLWGVLHALSPGHGKTVVSAFLLGANARVRHAVALGLTVTLTHTAVVLVLALAALLLEDRFVFPRWLEPVGAALILLVGLNQARGGLQRLFVHGAHGHTHHHHEHDHVHAAGLRGLWHRMFHHHHHVSHGGVVEDISVRGLAALGISGGLVPCPAAIVLALLSWQLRAPALGFGCILAFGAGLAASLTAIGAMAVTGVGVMVRWLGHTPEKPARLLIWLPVVGGGILVLYGALALLRCVG